MKFQFVAAALNSRVFYSVAGFKAITATLPVGSLAYET